MRYDTLPPKDTTLNHLCPRDNFYFYFFIFLKKIINLARRPPYHMGKVIKSYDMG
jgi:hypothetical protein